MEIITSALMGIFLFSGIGGMAINIPKLTSITTAPAVVASAAVPTAVEISHLTVKITSYNAVPRQTDGTPLITASGAYANSQIVAARSHDLASTLPFGTIIAINEQPSISPKTCGYDLVASQVGYRVIADTMNASKHNQIDVLLNRHRTVRVGRKVINPSIVLGMCHGMNISIVGHLNINHMPTTQAELAELVSGDTQTNTLALR